MMSNKGPSAEDERKCLGSMGISQQFGWTGLTASISAALSSSSSTNGGGSGDKGGGGGGGGGGGIKGSSSSSSLSSSLSSSDGISSIIASEGLILWNMLGYALKDSDDYQSFVLVNKQWNAMVKLLEPPVIFRINALMAKAAQQKAQQQQQQQQQQQSSNNNRSVSNNRSNSNNRGSGGGGGSSGSTGSSNNPSNTLLRQQAVSLLDATYVEMKDRNSGLYRKDNKREAAAASAAGIPMSGGGGIAKKWPLVQPNFKMILMLFAHDACSTANLSQQIYEMTRRHLKEISTSVAQTIISIIIEENSSNNTDEDVDDYDANQDDRLNKVLIELIEQWNRWEGLTQIYTDITSYVNRYYVKHHSLTSTTQLANEFFAFALRKSIIAVDKNRKPVVNSIVNLLEKLDPTIMNNQPQKLQSKLILFHEAMVACDKCGQLVEPDQWSSGGGGSNSNNNNNNDTNNNSTSAPSTDEMTRLRNRNIIGRIQTKYNEIKNAFINATGSSSNNNFGIGITTSAVPSRTESDDNNDNDKDNNDNITIEFPDGTANIYPSEHFLQSSGLLQNLRLCHGDKIRLQQSSSLVTYRNEFIKAIEFYNIDEHDPMPTIETPIRNWDMNVIVGRTYTNFITSLSSPQLMSIIVFANLMDCKKLLDLATLKVSMQIRTMSPAELRTFFNITN